ncbi:hypothetical protein [Neorhodopirellula lusitana]|nr:hypothetical protein [Neorhodopirellula lusitana]
MTDLGARGNRDELEKEKTDDGEPLDKRNQGAEHCIVVGFAE